MEQTIITLSSTPVRHGDRLIPHLRKCILRKRDTAAEIFGKFSIYKKVSILSELHFLIHSLILVKFIIN